MGNVVFTVLPQVGPIGIQHRRRVVIHAGYSLFVNRHYHRHSVFLGQFLHQSHCGSAGNGLGHRVPSLVLLGAEVGTVEDLLQTEDLHSLTGRLFDESEVLLQHVLL